jgi:hypothetical protein
MKSRRWGLSPVQTEAANLPSQLTPVMEPPRSVLPAPSPGNSSFPYLCWANTLLSLTLPRATTLTQRSCHPHFQIPEFSTGLDTLNAVQTTTSIKNSEPHPQSPVSANGYSDLPEVVSKVSPDSELELLRARRETLAAQQSRILQLHQMEEERAELDLRIAQLENREVM